MRATPSQQAKLAARLPKQAASKLGNTWTKCLHGHSHQSQKESQRCEELELLQKGGLIVGLNRKVRFYLTCNRYYESDFTWFETMGLSEPWMVIEDVKGRQKGQRSWKYESDAHKLFALKADWLKQIYKIEVTET